MKDLIILCADKDAQLLLQGLLPRLPLASGLRVFHFDIFAHPQRDTGVLNTAHEFLRPFPDRYSKALVVWDLEGCGQETKGAQTLEVQVEENLARNGWAKERVCAIAIAPELENWIWGLDETHLENAFGWKSGEKSINEWVRQQGLWSEGLPKPSDPKRAVEAALRKSKKSWSSAIHKQIAAKASYRRCQDRAFLKMLESLKAWFQPSV